MNEKEINPYTEREMKIYRELYESPRSKEYFADFFEIVIKSVENITKNLREDIVYDRKIGAYRFKSLLPTFIPPFSFVSIFGECAESQVLKEDISVLRDTLHIEGRYTSTMRTSSLSSMAQKIIKGHLGIISGCVLEIDYQGSGKLSETKYVRPHRILFSDNVYYLIGSYDKKNKTNVGERRTFAFSAISDIRPFKYLAEGKLTLDGEFNAYGEITKEKFVTLELRPRVASFFKRENKFQMEEYDFVSEELDGTTIVKMYYNEKDEIRRFVQKWIPFVDIKNDDALRSEIFGEIMTDLVDLIGIGTEEGGGL